MKIEYNPNLLTHAAHYVKNYNTLLSDSVKTIHKNLFNSMMRTARNNSKCLKSNSGNWTNCTSTMGVTFLFSYEDVLPEQIVIEILITPAYKEYNTILIDIE